MRGHNPPLGHSSRGAIAPAAVGPLLMVRLPIWCNDDPCVSPAERPLQVHASIAACADAALHRAVLPRLARLDKRGADALGRQPGLHGLGHDCWAMVAAARAGPAERLDAAHDNLAALLGGDGAANRDGPTPPGIRVHDHPPFEGRPMGPAVVHESRGPPLMRPYGRRGPHGGQPGSLPAMPSAHVPSVRPPEARDPGVIHPPPLPRHQGPDAPIAIARVALGQGPHRGEQLRLASGPPWRLAAPRA